jgi:hypothetical protein
VLIPGPVIRHCPDSTAVPQFQVTYESVVPGRFASLSAKPHSGKHAGI